MPKKNFYAVKVGTVPGIYSTWDECKAMTQGFPGNQYKGFATEQEALDYMGHGSKPAPTPASIAPKPRAPQVVESSQFTSPDSPVEEVYTDGCSRGNGREGAVAGVGVFYGHDDPRNRSLRLPGARQTNQRAELFAIYLALKDFSDKIDKTAAPNSMINIYSDSKYSINCLEVWIHKWLQNGFVNSKGDAVENSDIIRDAYDLIDKINRRLGRTKSSAVQFTHVRGHTGIAGNEAADWLANMGALGRSV